MLQGDQYRRHREFLRFLGASTVSLIFAKWTHKTLFALNVFHSNIRVPMNKTDTLGSQAITLSSGLSTGIFSMVLFGTCWINDIDSIEEFTQGFRHLLKPFNEHNHRQQEELITQEDDQSLSELWNSLKDK
ncbi:Altered inheritance of mitochondria protein 11 [Monosporozyma unispora]|nr:Altered inheritance of mitochondria protein 11 [Kazachstania unispora]